MAKLYSGLYHVKGTVKSLGIEGLEPYKGNVNSDCLLVDDFDSDDKKQQKVLVDILDIRGERVPAYVLSSKLVRVPHKPVQPVDLETHLMHERRAYDNLWRS